MEAKEEAKEEEAEVAAAPPAAREPERREERREVARFMLVLQAHLMALQEIPNHLGASKWKFNATRGAELETWSAEVFKIKGKSGKACLRTRLLSETAIKMKQPDGTFEQAGASAGLDPTTLLNAASCLSSQHARARALERACLSC